MRRPLPLAMTALLILVACKDDTATDDTASEDTATDDTATNDTGPVDADGDGAAADVDCDDTDPAVFPGAEELCNGVDDNCDGSVDEDSATDASTWYGDGDGDGYGDAAVSAVACAAPDGFVADATDCDDGAAAVNPGATELCNSVDDNCDGSVDEDSAVDASTWYADSDSDGYGDAAVSAVACAAPDGFVADLTDCDDGAAAVNPGATELCNGVDDDCDSVTDEPDAADALTWFADTDGDGYGDASTTTPGCSQPSGYVADDSDCDDGEGTAFPGSTATETPFDGVDQDCDGLDERTDLNGDGVPDLVVAHSHEDGNYAVSSSVYLSANGALPTNTSSALVGLPTYGARGAHVADLNGDGYQDILFVNYYSGGSYSVPSRIYWGSSSSYSASNATDLPGTGPLQALVEDLNGDGYPDIVLGSYFDGNYQTLTPVYFGSSSGYSTSSFALLEGYGVRDVVAGDFNSDGYQDLVLVSYYDGGSDYSTTSYVYYGSSSGTYDNTRRGAYPGYGGSSGVVADLDADGYDDLVVASYYDGDYETVSKIYWGSSGGLNTANVTGLSTQGPYAVEVGDFNGDGDLDIVFSSLRSGSGSVSSEAWAYYGDGTRSYGPSRRASLAVSGSYDLVVADVDADGYDDVAFSAYYDGDYSTVSALFYGSSVGLLSTPDTFNTLGSQGVSACDLDDDGLMELTFGSYFNGSTSRGLFADVYTASTSGYSSAPAYRYGITANLGGPVWVGGGAGCVASR